MWTSSVLLAAALLSGPSAVAQSEDLPQALEWLVLGEINRFTFDMDRPAYGPPLLTALPAGVFNKIDLTHDGVADWIIKWPESAQFCGTGGCRITIYASDSEGLVRVFDQQVLEGPFFDETGGAVHLSVSLHHSSCTDEQSNCRHTWNVDPQNGTMRELSTTSNIQSTLSDKTAIDPIWDLMR